MRRSALAFLLQLAVTAPLAAQFEGTVSMKVSGAGAGGDVSMKMVVKGDQQATIMSMPAAAGPLAGSEVRMIFDPSTNMATTLIPVTPQMQQSPMFANAKGIKMVMDVSKTATSMTNGAADENVEIKKLGTSQRIAGFDCDDFEITSSKGQAVRACIAQALGHFLFPQIGGAMGRPSPAPAWTKAFGTKPGFPLKVWSASGDIAMEVTSVEKGSVPASMFEIPEGYMDMSAMMRGRGGF